MAITVPRLSVPQVQESGLPNMQAPTQAPLEQFGGGAPTASLFGAAHDGINAGLQLRTQMRDHANEVAQQDKLNQLDTSNNTFLNDPQNGAMFKRGKNSFGLPDEAKTYFEDQKKTLTKDMTEQQRFMFEPQFEARYKTAMSEIYKHVGAEAKTYDHDVSKSQISLSQQRAVINPATAPAEIQNQHNVLALLGDRQGMSSEEIQKLQTDASSKTYKDIITTALAGNQLGTAKQLMNAHKGEMNAEDLTHVNDHIERKTELEAQKAMRLEMEKTTNPWKWALHTGTFGKPEPLVLTGDPAVIQNSVEKRLEFIDTAHKGGLELPFTSPWEGKPFADAFTKMPPEQAVKAVSTWSDVAQKYQAPLAMAMFPHSPGLSGAAMMSGENPTGAAKAFYGHQLLDHKEGEKAAVEPPASEKFQEGVDAYIGNSITDAPTRKALVETAKNIMVATMFKASKTNFKEFGDSDLRDAVDEAIGKPANINGRTTVTFRGKDNKHLEPGQLSDLISSVRNEDVQAIQGDVPKWRCGEPIDMKSAGDKLQYVSVGHGKYNILTPEGFAYGKDGDKFILDLKSIEQKVPPKKGWFDSFKHPVPAKSNPEYAGVTE